MILWTVLLETLGLAGSWGPMAGHFKPMTGGFRYWARPDTIRLAPWPGKVPFTAGDRRTVGDVALYLAIIATLVAALVLPSVSSASLDRLVPGNAGLVDPTVLFVLIGLLVVMGLRDKVVFLAARSEQYLPAIVFFATLGYVDMIVALKLLIVVVWVGAGVSKFGHAFLPGRVAHGQQHAVGAQGAQAAQLPELPRRPAPVARGRRVSPTSAARPSRSSCPSSCCSRPTRRSRCWP